MSGVLRGKGSRLLQVALCSEHTLPSAFEGYTISGQGNLRDGAVARVRDFGLKSITAPVMRVP